MNKLRLLSLAARLKTLAIEVENEIKSDASAYIGTEYQPDYEDILTYYQANDDDSEEGL